jgi:hypothetical protein
MATAAARQIMTVVRMPAALPCSLRLYPSRSASLMVTSVQANMLALFEPSHAGRLAHNSGGLGKIAFGTITALILHRGRPISDEAPHLDVIAY